MRFGKLVEENCTGNNGQLKVDSRQSGDRSTSFFSFASALARYSNEMNPATEAQYLRRATLSV